jgi:hypothetical protein
LATRHRQDAVAVHDAPDADGGPDEEDLANSIGPQ